MKNFDMNKAIGVLCAAGLLFLAVYYSAEKLFDGTAKPAEGEEVAQQAYVIDTGVEDAGGESAEAVNPAVFLAVADPAKGEKIFAKCKACHTLEKHGVGPELGDVYGRLAGSVAGFSFSSAMAESGLTWDANTLFQFLGDVKGTVKGTKMSFAGIKPEQDRADIIAFLAGDKFDRASFEAAAAAPAEGEEATPAETSESTPEEATEEGVSENTPAENDGEAVTEEAPTTETQDAPNEVSEAAPVETLVAETTPVVETAVEVAEVAPNVEAPAEEAPVEVAAVSIPAGDAAVGEKLFRRCQACHKAEAGKNSTGPTMFGILNRPAGSVEGYSYSKGMKESGITWNEASLFEFIGDAKGTVKGTKMSFAGIKKEQERADIIAYLATLK